MTAASPAPQFGVRLERGIVTYLNNEPLLTWEQADDARRKIADVTGEHGEVEKVFVLRTEAAEHQPVDYETKENLDWPSTRSSA